MCLNNLKDPRNTIFLVRLNLVVSILDTQNLKIIFNKALLTPEKVSKEFKTHSIEIKLAPKLSGTIQETLFFITIIVLPTLSLNLEIASEYPSFIILDPFPNISLTSGSLQQINKPKIFTNSPAMPEFYLNLHYFKVNSLLKNILANRVILETLNN